MASVAANEAASPPIQLPAALPSGNLDELKKLVIATLEKNGALGDLRAQLRSCVYKAIESDDYVNDKNPGAKLLSENPNGALVAELVAEFLEYYHLAHTLRIYVPELNLPRFRLSRRELEQECGIRTQTDPSQSLLQHLVATALNTSTCGSPIIEGSLPVADPNDPSELSQASPKPYEPLVTKSPSPDRSPAHNSPVDATVGHTTPGGGHFSANYVPRSIATAAGGELPSSLQEAQASAEPPVHVFGSLNVMAEGSAHADSLLSTDWQSGQPRAPPPSTTDGDEASLVTSSARDMMSPLGHLGSSDRAGLSVPHWTDDLGVDRTMSSASGDGSPPSGAEHGFGARTIGSSLLGDLPPLKSRPGMRGSPVKVGGFEDGVGSSSPEREDLSDREGPSAVEESLEENVLRLARLTDEIQSLMRKPGSASSPQTKAADSGPQGDSDGKDSPRYEDDWAASSASSSHRSVTEDHTTSKSGYHTIDNAESGSRDSSMPSVTEESQDSSGQLDALCEYIEDDPLTVARGGTGEVRHPASVHHPTYNGQPAASSLTSVAAGSVPDGILGNLPLPRFTTTEAGEPMQRGQVGWNEGRRSAMSVTVTVNPQRRHQTIHGFGGAFTQAAAYLYKNLSPSTQKRYMDLVFGADGLRYSLGRVPINSCDFSPDTYNFDNVSDDFDLKSFDRDLQKDEELGMFAMIQDAQSHSKGLSGLNLLASPWSPPYWMKTGNHEMIGSEMPCLKSDQRYHRTWAEYRSLWFQGYAKRGINFTYHTVQNEPANYVNVWWEQCFFDAKGEADFIADHLGPVMERDGFQSIGLLFHDYNKGGMNDWADVVLAHPNATKYISGIALHWYDGYHFNNVQAFHNQYGADYYQLATEGCNCDGVLDWQYDTEWKRAMRYVG
ncbi:hypothetical protein FOZ60_013671 [Perkinsus olseni]|uniref:Glucosylceramidase n=4 Tax=Perkinsus olseni TaxID=32597 RepID=A0A7J6N974_PEROL|nr:hypothetical protein FOZ60_013671 [Perkinsus olseni]